MASYQQMGHHSTNLLFEASLRGYGGAILSPVNYPPGETGELLVRCRDELPDWDILFDPQLYYPNTERGFLDRWDYFPRDVDTADMSSEDWWRSLTESLAAAAQDLSPSGLCSPVAVPRAFTDEYYLRSVETAAGLAETLTGTEVRTLQTALVNLNDLASPTRPLEIASILTRGQLPEVYLVAIGDQEPRREYHDTEGLKGAMALIRALERAGVRVLVGFSSSDMVLWKAAGASSCATGKFFNLRRFTSSRFEEPSGGGGQLPYWFEEDLVAFLRESDLVRVQQQGLIGESSLRNPYWSAVVEKIEAGEPWVGLGWRQFMFWFAEAESRIASGGLEVRRLLRDAESSWRRLEDNDVLMEEPRNDGTWLRPWRRALSEY